MPRWQVYNLLKGKGFEVGLSEDEVASSLAMSTFGPGLRARRKRVDELFKSVKEQINHPKPKKRKGAQVRACSV